MFSKAEGPDADAEVRPRLATMTSTVPSSTRRLSLTVRLAIAVGLLSALVFGGVGAYLYRALAMQVVERDDAELLRKAVRVREELGGYRDGEARTLREVAQVVSGNDEFALSVHALDGNELVAANLKDGPQAADPLSPLAPQGPVGADTAIDAQAIRVQTSRAGHPMHAVDALARTATGEPLRFTVFHTALSRLALLRAYRTKLFAAALAGSLSMAALGWIVLRAGMTPLRHR
jgi:two-component system heavy metal sensor histidine kinase CusS